jgi:hypothetical protein
LLELAVVPELVLLLVPLVEAVELELPEVEETDVTMAAFSYVSVNRQDGGKLEPISPNI